MMRILFLALLFANVVAFFLLSGSGRQTQPQSVPVPIPASQPLKLLSELSPQERADLAKPKAAASVAPAPVVPAARSASAPAVAAPLICASYGPFPGDTAAKRGKERLKKAGAQVSQRLVAGKVKLGYWVYLPSFQSRKEADAAKKVLQKRGVKDLYVVADEANRNAISLGVYSQRSGALERRREIRKLGFHPLFADRFRDTPNYWLDARGTAGQLPRAKAFSDLAEGDVGIVRSEGVCPAGNDH